MINTLKIIDVDHLHIIQIDIFHNKQKSAWICTMICASYTQSPTSSSSLRLSSFFFLLLSLNHIHTYWMNMLVDVFLLSLSLSLCLSVCLTDSVFIVSRFRFVFVYFSRWIKIHLYNIVHRSIRFESISENVTLIMKALIVSRQG